MSAFSSPENNRGVARGSVPGVCGFFVMEGGFLKPAVGAGAIHAYRPCFLMGGFPYTCNTAVMKILSPAILSILAVSVSLAFANAAEEKKSASAAHGGSAVAKAVAVIQPTEGNKVTGKVTFTSAPDGLHVVAELKGLEPGDHGFHIHEFGDVSSADGKAAGDHFNPLGKPHAGADTAEHHSGDMGNIKADASGNAKLDVVLKGASFEGHTSVIGRGVIVHGKADDLKTQPSGNAGPRIGQGVIGIAKP